MLLCQHGHSKAVWFKMVDQEIIQQLQRLGHTLDFSQAKVGKWQKRGLRPETRQLLESRFIALEIRGKEARGLWWVCPVSFLGGVQKGRQFPLFGSIAWFPFGQHGKSIPVYMEKRQWVFVGFPTSFWEALKKGFDGMFHRDACRSKLVAIAQGCPTHLAVWGWWNTQHACFSEFVKPKQYAQMHGKSVPEIDAE